MTSSSILSWRAEGPERAAGFSLWHYSAVGTWYVNNPWRSQDLAPLALVH